VRIFDGTNTTVYDANSSSASPVHVIDTFLPGNYFVIGKDIFGNYSSIGYPNVNCASFEISSCESALTPVVLDFGMSPKRISLNAFLLYGISGFVTEESTGEALDNIIIDLWNSNGNVVTSTTTGITGGFSFERNSGDYYLTTDTNNGFANEVYQDIACDSAAILGTCDVTQGTLVNVPFNNTDPIIIDIELTNDPIFANGFE
jgi:hypothetical protein